MRPRWLLALALWPTASQAGPADYRFEPVTAVVARGVGVPLKVQVWSRGGNVLVPGVEMGDARVDRSPEGQLGGVLPAFFTPSLDYGTYGFRADLPTDGTWALKFTARIPGEAQPIPGSVTFKVVGRLPDAKPPNRRP
jgi:hypothetical protein